MSKILTGKEALIALAEGKTIENWNGSIWWDVEGTWQLDVFLKTDRKFRLKPHTITINGVDIEAPEKNDDPDLELLEHDQDYWLVDLTNYPDFVIPHKWKGDPPEYVWADRGLIHLSKDAALLHAKALILASGGTA